MSKQSIPNARRQPHAVDYAARVLLNEAAKGGDASAMPLLPGDAASIQRPTSSPVPTVSDYPTPPRDVISDDK